MIREALIVSTGPISLLAEIPRLSRPTLCSKLRRMTAFANSEPVESAPQQRITGTSRPTEANGSTIRLRQVFPNLGQTIPHHRSQTLQITQRLAEGFKVLC